MRALNSLCGDLFYEQKSVVRKPYKRMSKDSEPQCVVSLASQIRWYRNRLEAMEYRVIQVKSVPDKESSNAIILLYFFQNWYILKRKIKHCGGRKEISYQITFKSYNSSHTDNLLGHLGST